MGGLAMVLELVVPWAVAGVAGESCCGGGGPSVGVAGVVGVVEVVGDGLGWVGLHAGHYVGVDVQGDGGVCVSESLGDDVDGYTGCEGDGGVGVSQVVEPDSGQPEVCADEQEPFG